MSGSVSVFCALYTKYHRVVKTNKEKTTGFRCFSSCEHNPCELTKNTFTKSQKSFCVLDIQARARKEVKIPDTMYLHG